MIREGALYAMFKWLTIGGLVVVTLLAVSQRWPEFTFYLAVVACLVVVVGVGYDVLRGAAWPRT
jgi:hypothetical protein